VPNSRSVGLFQYHCTYHVRWVPCHCCMVRPQVADGGDSLQMWRVAANIVNKQSQTADKGWSSSLGVGRRATGCDTDHYMVVANIRERLAASK
jgi:hypothetical protein